MTCGKYSHWHWTIKEQVFFMDTSTVRQCLHGETYVRFNDLKYFFKSPFGI